VKDLTVALDSEGKAWIQATDADNGTTDDQLLAGISVSRTTFTCADLGENNVVFRAIDSSGNEAQVNFIVDVKDITSPVLKIRSEVTLPLDLQGRANLTWSMIDAGSSDNCGITEIIFSEADFGCTKIGNQKVTCLIRDLSGNVSSGELIVNVVDNSNPEIKVKSGLTIQIGPDGASSIDWKDIDDGSTDNCGITTRSLSKTQLTTADIGDNKITYTVSDASGNRISSEFILRVTTVVAIPAESSAEGSVQLFPNPAKDQMAMRLFNISLVGFVQILDISGKMICFYRLDSARDGIIRIDVTAWPSGIYFLHILSDSFEDRKKFIVEK